MLEAECPPTDALYAPSLDSDHDPQKVGPNPSSNLWDTLDFISGENSFYQKDAKGNSAVKNYL